MILKDIKKDGKVVGFDYQNKTGFNFLIKKDLKDCEKTILAVCEGRFPK